MIVRTLICHASIPDGLILHGQTQRVRIRVGGESGSVNPILNDGNSSSPPFMVGGHRVGRAYPIGMASLLTLGKEVECIRVKRPPEHRRGVGRGGCDYFLRRFRRSNCRRIAERVSAVSHRARSWRVLDQSRIHIDGCAPETDSCYTRRCIWGPRTMSWASCLRWIWEVGV